MTDHAAVLVLQMDSLDQEYRYQRDLNSPCQYRDLEELRLAQVRKSKIQELFKDFHGDVSGTSRTIGLKRRR
jgi:ActR/RegA family two-component response regulator